MSKAPTALTQRAALTTPPLGKGVKADGHAPLENFSYYVGRESMRCLISFLEVKAHGLEFRTSGHVRVKTNSLPTGVTGSSDHCAGSRKGAQVDGMGLGVPQKRVDGAPVRGPAQKPNRTNMCMAPSTCRGGGPRKNWRFGPQDTWDHCPQPADHGGSICAFAARRMLP